MPPRRDSQSYQTGKLAEWLCILRLWLTGWRILATRWRSPAGEIDLIAVRGRQLAFVEVKARRNHDEAVTSLSATQRQRIQQAAGMWLASHPKYAGHECRFDVMSVSKWPWPRCYENAF